MFFEVSKAKTIDKKYIVNKGKEIYQRHAAGLERSHKGQYIIIEIESGDFLIDKNSSKARARMQRKYPDTIFYAAKIGSPAMFNFQ